MNEFELAAQFGIIETAAMREIRLAARDRIDHPDFREGTSTTAPFIVMLDRYQNLCRTEHAADRAESILAGTMLLTASFCTEIAGVNPHFRTIRQEALWEAQQMAALLSMPRYVIVAITKMAKAA